MASPSRQPATHVVPERLETLIVGDVLDDTVELASDVIEALAAGDGLDDGAELSRGLLGVLVSVDGLVATLGGALDNGFANRGVPSASMSGSGAGKVEYALLDEVDERRHGVAVARVLLDGDDEGLDALEGSILNVLGRSVVDEVLGLGGDIVDLGLSVASGRLGLVLDFARLLLQLLLAWHVGEVDALVALGLGRASALGGGLGLVGGRLGELGGLVGSVGEEVTGRDDGVGEEVAEGWGGDHEAAELLQGGASLFGVCLDLTLRGRGLGAWDGVEVDVEIGLGGLVEEALDLVVVCATASTRCWTRKEAGRTVLLHAYADEGLDDLSQVLDYALSVFTEPSADTARAVEDRGCVLRLEDIAAENGLEDIGSLLGGGQFAGTEGASHTRDCSSQSA
jgi:hypothetical protein